MGLWLREWLRVGTAIALVGGLLWLLAERDVGLAALLRSAAWGLVLCGSGAGLSGSGCSTARGREDVREQSSRGR